MKPYVDDHGNPPGVRKLHVCRKHGKAYCGKGKCVKQIKRRIKRKACK